MTDEKQKIILERILAEGFVKQKDETFGYHKYKRYLPEGAEYKNSEGYEIILYDPSRVEIFARFKEFWDAERNKAEREREKQESGK